jgi:sarcosine oxidase/L-pipecolate oxidase
MLRMCWDTECMCEACPSIWTIDWFCTAHDQNWLITPHPSSPSSLLIATGGSSHSFKNLTNVGKYIVQALEAKLEDHHRQAWKWRPEKVGKGLDEHATRAYKMALHEASGWKHEEPLT